MKLCIFFLCWLGGLALVPAAQAQQLAPPPPADVLLLTTGQEVRGHVLSITPTELTCLSPRPGLASPPDTLRLPVAGVFLVRYANGTREVLAPLLSPAPPPDLTPPALRGLDATQRRQLGLRDAGRYYRATGPFWGTLGATLYLGPLLGLAPAIGIGSHAVRAPHLAAPEPALLQDTSYGQGYQQQANRLKRRRTWGGYALATALYVAAFAALASGQ